MKIFNLTEDSEVYTSNSYLLLGDWNALDDVNTLIDTGADDSIVERIKDINTGVGKKAISQVILTHNHFDHTGALSAIREHFSPVILAHAVDGCKVDRPLKDGQKIRVADRMFEVIHTPGHSHDSICLYCREEKVLFAGDTPVNIRSSGGSYEPGFVAAIERLSKLDIETIYFGHGAPLLRGGAGVIRSSLKTILKSERKHYGILAQ